MPKPRVVWRRAAASLLLCLVLPACGESKLVAGAEAGDASTRRSVASPRKAGAHGAVGAAGASQGSGSLPGGTTFWQDVKPIFDAKCGRCHREGGIGPFELQTYASAYEHRTHILAAVVSRHMPPWLAGDGCDDYSNDPRLSDSQIETISAWVRGSVLEGDPATPGAPLDAGQALELGRVDATVSMQAPYTQTLEPDELRCFVLDWPVTTTRYVTGFRAKPDNSAAVHHVIAYAASPEQVAMVEQLDADASGDGYPCYGGPGFDGSWVGAWGPGTTGLELPEGSGVKVERGSKLVVQMHYNTENVSGGSDQSSFDFKLDDVVEKDARFTFFTKPDWVNGDMPIPAGAPLVTHQWGSNMSRFTGARPIDIYAIFTHQHQLGTRSHVELRDEQGTDCLLELPRWDWHWQNAYYFGQPKRVNPGDVMYLECQWDNSAEHQREVDGVPLPPQDVNWGATASDEMCLAALFWSLAE